MTLLEATRDLHHAAERHPWGARMAAGDIGPQEWCDWIGALRLIHGAIDDHLPPCARRGWELLHDQVAMMPMLARPIRPAQDFARSLTGAAEIAGAAYILIGAHFRGGAVIRRRLPEGFPTAHLRFDDARGAEAFVRTLRDLPALAPAARACFAALIDVMDVLEATR